MDQIEKTPSALLAYAKDRHFDQQAEETAALRRFRAITQTLSPEDTVRTAFLGVDQFQSSVRHGGLIAAVITDDRIILAAADDEAGQGVGVPGAGAPSEEDPDAEAFDFPLDDIESLDPTGSPAAGILYFELSSMVLLSIGVDGACLKELYQEIMRAVLHHDRALFRRLNPQADAALEQSLQEAEAEARAARGPQDHLPPAGAKAPAAPVDPVRPGGPAAPPKTAAARPQPVTEDLDQELRRLKKLLDDGILTEEEFTAKKRQLLGL